MPCTPAQQALDQAESTAFMRNFYTSLGMREQILERAIQQAKEPSAPGQQTPMQSAQIKRRPGRPRRR
jgi:hypothetical protein